MELRVTAEEVPLLLAWAEERDDPELLATVRGLAALDLKLVLAQPDEAAALLSELRALPECPPVALLFGLLDASPEDIADGLSAVERDPGLALALGSSLLLDRSDARSAARILTRVAMLPGGLGDLAGRFLEFALLLGASYPELARLLDERPPPGFAPAPVRRAEALLRAGAPEAVGALTALAEAGYDAYACARLEEVLESRGDWAALAQLYRGAVAHTPSPQDRSLLLLRLGEILEERLDQPAEAAAVYGQAEGGRLSAAITTRRRWLHRKKGQWDEYADCLREEALQVEDRRRAAALDLVAGRTLIEAVGDPFEAARAFEEAAQLYPEDPRSQEFLAEALLVAGDVEGLAALHSGVMAAVIRRDPAGLSGVHPALQAIAAQRVGDERSLSAALRRWAELEAQPRWRALLQTLAAHMEPDRARARQDVLAALEAAPEFLPALLCLARLCVLDGRLRQATEALSAAAQLAGEGQIRILLLLEAADVATGLADPSTVARLHRGVADTLFAGEGLPIDPATLASVLGEGGDWEAYAPAILREARKAGHVGTLTPVLLELARQSQGPAAAAALRMAVDILPEDSVERERLVEVLEGSGRWEELAALLEGQARRSLNPRRKIELLGRVEVIARGHGADQGWAGHALRRARVAMSRAPAPPTPSIEAAAISGAALLAEAQSCTDWDRSTGFFLKAGELFRLEGDPAAAERAYQDVLARDATEAQALSALAELAREQGDWDGAREWLARLSELEDDVSVRLDLLLMRARIAAEHKNDLVAAARDYEACLALQPGCREALEALERAAHAGGDPESLRHTYLQQLERPDLEPARRVELLEELAGLEVGALDHPERALAHLKRALSLRPGDVGLLRKLADAAGRGQLWRERVEALESLARQIQDPGERSSLYLEVASLYREHLGGGPVVLENTMVAFVCDNTNTEAFSQLERLYMEEQRWREVVGIYDVALASARAGGPYEEALLLKRKGIVLARYGSDPHQAAAVLLDALSLDSDDEIVAEWLTRLLEHLGDASARLRMLDILQAHRRGRERVELLLQAAAVARSLAEGSAPAEQYLRRALAADPADERPLLALEEVLAAEQRWEELVELYQQGATSTESEDTRRQVLLRAAVVVETRIGDVRRAIGAYQRLLEEDEQDLDALRALARLYELTRGWDELLAVSRRELVATEEPERRGLILFRIGSILETHHHDETGAEAAYQQALAVDPRCFPALHGLRDLNLRRQDWSQAVSTLEREAALWQEPRDQAAVLVRLGDILLRRLGDRARAMAAYRRALRTAPGFPAAARALLPLLIQEEAWEEASPLARLVTRLAASQDDPAERCDALAQRALVALRRQEPREAAGALSLALQIDPEHRLTQDTLRELVLGGGWQAVEPDQLDVLLRALERVPGASRSLGWIHVLRGQVAEARLRVDEALRHYRVAAVALQAAPESCRPLISLLTRLRRFGEAVEVLELMAQQSRTRPERLAALAASGRLLMDHRGEAGAALARFVRVSEELLALRALDGDNGYGVADERILRDCLFLGAQAAWLERRWSEGLDLLKRLIALEADDPRELHGRHCLSLYLYYAGRFLRDGLGQPAEAAALFYRAIEEGPGSANPLIAMARLFWDEGDHEELEELLAGQIEVLEETSGPAEALRLRAFQAQLASAAGDHQRALQLVEGARGRPGVDPVMLHSELASLAGAAHRTARVEAELREVLRVGGPAAGVLERLERLYLALGHETRRALVADLREAVLDRAPSAGALAALGARRALPAAASLPREALVAHVLHRDVDRTLVQLWEPLTAELRPGLVRGAVAVPLDGPGHDDIQRTAAQLAAAFGVPPPRLLLADGAQLPVTIADDALVLRADLPELRDPVRLAFWLAGPLFLQQLGLGMALHPEPGVSLRLIDACLDALRWVAHRESPDAGGRQRGDRPPAAGLLAQRLLAERGLPAPPPSALARPEAVLDALRRSRQRAGALCLGSPGMAHRLLRLGLPGDRRGPEEPALLGADLVDLVHYAVSSEHLEVRRQLGLDLR